MKVNIDFTQYNGCGEHPDSVLKWTKYCLKSYHANKVSGWTDSILEFPVKVGEGQLHQGISQNE